MVVAKRPFLFFIFINMVADIQYIYTNANFFQEQLLSKETSKEQTQKVPLLQERRQVETQTEI